MQKNHARQSDTHTHITFIKDGEVLACASYGLERPCSSFGPCPEEPVPKGNNPEVEYEGEEETMSEDLFPGEPGLGSGLADNQDEPYEPESPIAESERSAQRKPEQVRFQVDENERGAGQAKEVPVPVPPSAEEKAQHELHHANFEPWCEVCVMWQGRDKHHHRRKEDPKEIKRAHSVCRLHVLHQGGWIPRKISNLDGFGAKPFYETLM